MKRLILILVVIGLLFVGCDSGGNASTATPSEALEVTLPALKIGDTWTVKSTVHGVEFMTTYSVTGDDIVDGKDCYVTEATSSPPFMGFVESTFLKKDKETGELIRLQYSGELAGEPFTYSIIYSYSYSEPKYPIRVGKIWEETETQTITTDIAQETETNTKENALKYEVKTIEEITVPAGTFDCFRTVVYDDRGTHMETYWQSLETKMLPVKHVNHVTGDTNQLVSYSLST